MVAGLASYGAYRYVQTRSANKQTALLDRLSGLAVPSSRYEIPKGSTTPSLLKLSTKSRLDRLSDTPTILPRGTVFQRMTTNPEESLSGMLYAAHSEFDKQYYSGEFVRTINQRMPGKAVFKSLMDFDDEIRLPSQRERVSTYLEAMAAVRGKGPFSQQEAHSVISGYSQFASKMALRGPGVEEFISRLKAKGYNAVTDDNNAGTLSQSPVILFDVAGSIKKRQMIPHGSDDVAKAVSKTIDIMSKHGFDDLDELLGDPIEP